MIVNGTAIVNGHCSRARARAWAAGKAKCPRPTTTLRHRPKACISQHGPWMLVLMLMLMLTLRFGRPWT